MFSIFLVIYLVIVIGFLVEEKGGVYVCFKVIKLYIVLLCLIICENLLICLFILLYFIICVLSNFLFIGEKVILMDICKVLG